MSLFSKVADLLGGGIAETIVDAAKAYFPPAMTPQERAGVEEAIRKASRDHEVRLLELAQSEQALFDARIKEQEGTASDLKALPLIGSVIIFARGAQRPVWGFATLYMDWLYFFGGHTFTDKQESAMWVINLLVLGFLFGERAVKNVAPLITQAIQAKGKG